MSDNASLKDFLRDALNDHDAGASQSDMPTSIQARPVKGTEMGTLPGHAVEDFIARGGMGAVYRAKQVALQREVAVKVMTREADSPEMAERFRREALVLGRLAHPNIVPVYDIGTDDEGQLFYTMKLVKGRTLQHILNDLRTEDAAALKEHTLTSLLTVFRKVCDALAFAHSQGIIHRDLKPENVMVGEFGEVLVMDWGLAKTLRQGDLEMGRLREDAVSMSDSPMGSLSSDTLQGSVIGTPQYMSPEQARGEIDELDERSDIFSLGGVLYAILTLRPPVEGTTVDEILSKVRTGSITPPTSIGGTSHDAKARTPGTVLEVKKMRPLPHMHGGRVPPAISAVVMKALRVEKAERYQSVTDLSSDIEAYQGGFATKAENAGTLTQIKLLMLRHKAVAASLVAMLVLSIGFVLKVMASERKATHNAELALAQKEAARRELARAQIAVADTAAMNLDGVGLRHALDACPDDLRDSSWQYLSAKADASLASLDFYSMNVVWRETGKGVAGGEFLAAPERNPVIVVIEPDTGRILREWKTVIAGRKVIGLRPGGAELIISSVVRQEWEVLDCVSGASIQHHAATGKGWFDNPFLSADGKRLFILIAESNGRRLACIDRETKAVHWEQKDCFSAYYSRDGEWIAVMSASAGKPVRILRADTGETASSMEPGHSYLEDMSFNEDNTRVVGADFEGYATVWDRATGRRIQSFRASGGMLDAAVFTANGTLVTRGRESVDRRSQRLVHVWNPERVIRLDALLGSGKVDGGGALALDPKAGWLCTDGSVTHLWQVPVQRHRKQLPHVLPVPHVTFLGNHILIALQQGALAKVWRLGADEPRSSDQAPGTVISASDGSRMLFAGGADHSAHIASLATDGSVNYQKLPWSTKANSVALSKTGEQAVADDLGSNVVLYALDRAEPLRKMTVPGGMTCKSLAFAADDRRILAIFHMTATASGAEHSLACWDRDTGALVYQWVSTSPILALAISPDGSRFVWAGADKFIHIHHADDGHEESAFRAHDAAINGLAWHPTRPVLASVSDDLSLKLWNPGSGAFLTKAIGLSRNLLSVAFSPDGKTLAVGTADPVVLLFDSETLGVK